MAHWCTIESDPGVFTELIADIGVRGVQVEEVYALDDLSPEQFEEVHVYGLIFLFKWRNDSSYSRSCLDAEDCVDIFFAKQTINNACATQAILSILLNQETEIDIGEELRAFLDFARGFSAEMKGEAIGGSDRIRMSHNSFARQEPFVIESKKEATEDDDVYHFVSYVPINGQVYELDGLQNGPILLGEIPEGKDWLSIAQPEIERRIQLYTSSEIRFNLMAVVSDRLEVFTKKLERLQGIYQRIESIQSGTSSTEMDTTDESLPTDPSELESRKIALFDQIQSIEAGITAEEEKRQKWKEENIRRKHNYVPFIVTMLRILAQKKLLMRIVENAQSTPEPT